MSFSTQSTDGKQTEGAASMAATKSPATSTASVNSPQRNLMDNSSVNFHLAPATPTHMEQLRQLEERLATLIGKKTRKEIRRSGETAWELQNRIHRHGGKTRKECSNHNGTVIDKKSVFLGIKRGCWSGHCGNG